MTDDDTIRTLLLESIDAELGDRREVPRVDERALATRSARPGRRAVGLLPLAAAAAVAAIVTGTVAVVDQASSGPVRPATTHSSHAPTSPVPTPTPTDPESSRRSAASSQAAVRAAASRAAASRSSVAAARSAARAASASAASAASAAAASSAAASSAAASASAAAQAALLDRFRGPWLGHDRTLSVAASGIATEMLTAGCCSPQLHLTFRLTDVRGTVSRPVATATVTSVRPDPGFTYDPGEARPYVGESATIGIVGGVLGEPFTGTQYCARGVNQCGA